MKIWIKKHYNLINIVGSLLFFLLASFFYLENTPIGETNNTLTIGIFTDSFWNIQNGNTYKILDMAVEKLKEENPNIEVSYETGILKKDYSEWLYQKLIQDDAPDIFYILPEDFSKLIELNALEDLTQVVDYQDSSFSNSFYSSAYSSGQYNGQ